MSIAGPTSADALTALSPPSVLRDGVCSSVECSALAAATAAAREEYSSTAKPRCRRFLSRLSFGRAGPKTATRVSSSSPSASPRSTPAHAVSRISRSVSGATSVGRLPTSTFGSVDAGWPPRASDGVSNPGAAARHPLPLNARFFGPAISSAGTASGGSALSRFSHGLDAPADVPG